MTKRRCQATTARGTPCRARPLRDSDFCLLHSPDSSPADLGRRGGQARGKQPDGLELSDRETAKAALRKALDSGNAAAVVAAAQWLIKFDTSPQTEGVTVADARAQLDAKLDAIEERRRADGLVCPACDRPLPRVDASRVGEAESAPTPRS